MAKQKSISNLKQTHVIDRSGKYTYSCKLFCKTDACSSQDYQD
ncbi:hypothetical protein IMCC3317_44030 [Kordia antarctica]|uniref:Uncharacterized protein n=1 Tax=Kordia antarctica TaxID=1218801 RepID=A0A7L4ZQI7_9FLAO|nr:hypothetical protein IMCC3317_44030 [Kordia antarctica]